MAKLYRISIGAISYSQPKRSQHRNMKTARKRKRQYRRMAKSRHHVSPKMALWRNEKP